RAVRDVAVVPALHRLRLRDRDVCRRRARRHGFDSRRVLGRPHHRAGAADVDLDPALSVAEHRDLRGLPRHRVLTSARHVRPRLGTHVMGKPRAYLRQYAAIAIFALAYLALGSAVRDAYYQLIMVQVLVWAVMGLGWNMLSGYSGMISFGHAAFFGLGAYTVTIAFVKFGVTPWLGIPLGVVVGVIAGVLIGIPTFRLRGHYFALAMLAYPLAMLYVFEWMGYQEVSLPM